MKIAIDARFYGTEHTGLGRYTTNVLTHLPAHLKNHDLVVLLRRPYYDTVSLPRNCVKVLAEYPHYSASEQIVLPRQLQKIDCHLFYAFHFNVPIKIPIPFVVTIHDLIKTHFTSSDTTTRSTLVFRLKRLGYALTIRHAVQDAAEIIVPTNTVKNDILALFDADPTHIHVIPEAPDASFRERVAKPQGRQMKLPKKYLLFVGNAYPHKNLDVLVKAFKKLPEYELVVVAHKTPFLTRSLEGVDRARVHVLSDLTDEDLRTVYARAACLVAPSLMEGYGLPGIEALMVGTPVIASNIPVYREVYGDDVTYFDPHVASDLIRAVRTVRRKSRPITFSRTWDEVAKSIAEVLDESCARLR